MMLYKTQFADANVRMNTKNLRDTLRVAVLFGSAAMVMAAAAVVVGCSAVVKAPEGSACAAVMSVWAGWW
jgi:hypothetical protein